MATIPKESSCRQPGTIIEAMSNGMYRVELEDGAIIVAHIAMELKRYTVRILPGDPVWIALSPFDTSRGKISERR